MRIRTARNLSQDEVALGIYSQSTLSRIESDISAPTVEKVFKLLHRMDVSLIEFSFLQANNSYDTHLQNQFLYCINELDIVSFNTLNQKYNLTTDVTSASAFISWLQYCFNINFSKNKDATNTIPLQNIIEQDEFFGTDFAPIAWRLPMLPANTIYYTYKRWNSLFLKYPLHDAQDFLLVDSTISLGCIQYKQKEYEQAIHTFKTALSQAKKIENISRCIILCFIICNLTKEDSYKKQAIQLKELFSKDIIYDYWYNVINLIFDEVKE